MTDNPEWIEWNGGECPVAPDVIVQVRYRRRFRDQQALTSSTPARADWFRLRGSCDWWKHESPVRENDIVAYRVLSSD